MYSKNFRLCLTRLNLSCYKISNFRTGLRTKGADIRRLYLCKIEEGNKIPVQVSDSGSGSDKRNEVNMALDFSSFDC